MLQEVVPLIIWVVVGASIVSASVIPILRSKHNWGFKTISLGIYATASILFINYFSSLSEPVVFFFIVFMILFIGCYQAWQTKKEEAKNTDTGQK